jgi:hypothetical protein
LIGGIPCRDLNRVAELSQLTLATYFSMILDGAFLVRLPLTLANPMNQVRF